MIGFEDFLFQRFWLILPLWILVYGLDYYLTLLGAHYYQAGANEHFAVEGSYELTPEYQDTIDAGKKFSPKFIKALVISSALIAGLWALSKLGAPFLAYSKFLVGGLILRQGAVLLRHSRNIALFWHLKRHTGVSGKVQHSRWLSCRLSGIELLTLALASFLIFALTGSIPFLGGAVIIGITGGESLKTSHRELAKARGTK